MSEALGRKSVPTPAYRRTQSSFAAASFGKDPQARLAMDKALDSRIRLLETKTSTGVVNSDTQSPVAPLPPNAKLDVSKAASGQLSVTITNPEYLGKNLNPSRAAIVHRLEYSTRPDFSQKTVALPPGTQTHYTIATAGNTLFFRLTSSFDGVSFNKPQLSGAKTA